MSIALYVATLYFMQWQTDDGVTPISPRVSLANIFTRTKSISHLTHEMSNPGSNAYMFMYYICVCINNTMRYIAIGYCHCVQYSIIPLVAKWIMTFTLLAGRRAYCCHSHNVNYVSGTITAGDATDDDTGL